jgi:hypothetical protein
MFTRLRLLVVLAVLSIVAGGAFAAASGDAQARPIQFQAVDMHEFAPPGNPVAGAATLLRSETGISYRIYTTGLTPGHAYTIWTVIFNRPENCTDGCNRPNLDDARVRGSVFFGGSTIAGENGTGNFSDSVEKGPLPAGLQVNMLDVPAGTANGLIDPMKADIHLVLRTHGPLVASQADVQLSTFEPCEVCANVQVAEFPAP